MVVKIMINQMLFMYNDVVTYMKTFLRNFLRMVLLWFKVKCGVYY